MVVLVKAEQRLSSVSEQELFTDQPRLYFRNMLNRLPATRTKKTI